MLHMGIVNSDQPQPLHSLIGVMALWICVAVAQETDRGVRSTVLSMLSGLENRSLGLNT